MRCFCRMGQAFFGKTGKVASVEMNSQEPENSSVNATFKKGSNLPHGCIDGGKLDRIKP